jgi:hypothetical protein
MTVVQLGQWGGLDENGKFSFFPVIHVAVSRK